MHGVGFIKLMRSDKTQALMGNPNVSSLAGLVAWRGVQESLCGPVVGRTGACRLCRIRVQAMLQKLRRPLGHDTELTDCCSCNVFVYNDSRRFILDTGLII